MYQNQPRYTKLAGLKSSALALIFASTATFTVTAAPAANAATASTRQAIHQARIADLHGADVETLDWRQPDMKLRFDLSSSEWIDGVEFVLSMDPGDNVDRAAPILVSLNNAPPVKLTPKGRAFDARISLDSDYARPSGNVITVSYPATRGACVTPSDGSWTVNTAKSSVIMRTRSKSRAQYLKEVEDRLSNPVLAPKTVGIVATGALKERLEILGAQGIGLRMKTLPAFRTTTGNSGMDVVIGRRADISRHINDRSILNETGPKISIAKGSPLRLVITGDTEAQVLSAAKLFSERHLPSVRRTQASEGELRFQPAFADTHNTLSGKTKLSDIGFGFYARDWASTPNTIKFNVADPSAQSGRLLLRLSSSEDIADVSKFGVSLNGRSLGFTNLDKRRKTVAFDIPSGSLQGADNKLVMTPTFTKAGEATNFTCPQWDDAPGFYMGTGSRIEIAAEDKSPVTELSRLTAGSGPFADNQGANTHIVLATGTRSDRAAALKLAAKMAKASGTGWSEATVSSLHKTAAIDPGRNVIILGPLAKATGLLDDAPKTLSRALRGQPTLNVAGSIEKFASSDLKTTMDIYAARQRTSSRKTARGGIAAIYPSQTKPGTLTAVFSNTPGSRFSASVASLTKDGVWNDMHGSVARWNKDTVMMAQTAIAAPSFANYKTKHDGPDKFTLASLDFTQWDYSAIEDGFLNLTDKARDAGAVMIAKLNLDKKEIAQTPVKTAAIARPVTPIEKQPKAKAPIIVEAPVATVPVLTAELRGFSSPAQIKSQSRLSAPRLWDKVKAPFARKASAPDRVQKVATLEIKAPQIEGLKIKAPQFKASELRTPRLKQWTAKAKAPFIKARNKWNTSSWERKIRDAQFKLQPIGRKIKSVVGSDRNPVKGLMIKADRTFSYFGILLAMAFIFSILMLGIASPNSEDTKHL